MNEYMNNFLDTTDYIEDFYVNEENKEKEESKGNEEEKTNKKDKKNKNKFHKHNKNNRIKEVLSNNETINEDMMSMKNFQAMFKYLYNIHKEGNNEDILYTVVRDGEQKRIIKIGKGDFEVKTFNTKGIIELKGFFNTPIPLFIVENKDSYNKEKSISTKEMEEYFDKHAIIVVPKGGQAYEHKKYGQNIDHKKINYPRIPTYEEAILEGRNTIMETKINEENRGEFGRFIKKLQKNNIGGLKYYLYKGINLISDTEEIKFLEILRNMGIEIPQKEEGQKMKIVEHIDDIQERCNTTVNNKHLEALNNLINTFDTKKGKFIRI